jgi:hypothetical protein
MTTELQTAILLSTSQQFFNILRWDYPANGEIFIYPMDGFLNEYVSS